MSTALKYSRDLDDNLKYIMSKTITSPKHGMRFKFLYFSAVWLNRKNVDVWNIFRWICYHHSVSVQSS